MYPQSHFLFAYFVSFIFVKFGVFDYKVALFAAFAGVLVDVDHYITFLFKYKKMNFVDAWNKHVNGLYGGRSFIHHHFGFIIMTLIIIGLFFYSKNWFWIIGIGYYTHMFLDYTHLNILKIKERITIKEFGIVEKINKFEVLFDIFMVIAIILLLL